MKPLILYTVFYSMIGFCVYWTGSLLPLLALIAMPKYSHENGKETVSFLSETDEKAPPKTN